MAFGLSLTKQPLKMEYLAIFPPGHINRARRKGAAVSSKSKTKDIKQPKRDRRAAEAKDKRKRKIAEKSRKRNRRMH